MRKRLGTYDIVSRPVAVLLLFILTAGAGGCGIVPLASPKEIVRRAIDAQGGLKSVRMEMGASVEIEAAPGSLQRTTTTYRGEGYFEQPDKSTVTIETPPKHKVEVITIGDRMYVKQTGATAWTEKKVTRQQESAVAPASVTDYLKYTKNLQLVDKRGDTYHLKFDLDMGRYTKVVAFPGVDPSLFKGMAARMEMWVLKDKYYVKRAKMDMSGDMAKGGAGHLSESMELEFSGFNEPVTIEKPI